MSSEQKTTKPKASAKGPSARAKPVWANGLKRMYDAVVDEQIPSEFEDLLKKLDDAGDKQ